MGRVFREFTENRQSTFYCRKCKTAVATYANVQSKQFKCESGKAYLFKAVMNIDFAVIHDQVMATGKHSV